MGKGQVMAYSGGTSPAGRAGCGVGLPVWFPEKEVSNTIWFSSSNNCRSAVFSCHRGETGQVSDWPSRETSQDLNSPSFAFLSFMIPDFNVPHVIRKKRFIDFSHSSPNVRIINPLNHPQERLIVAQNDGF